MVTTIQVNELTLRLLKQLKQSWNVHSYDELLQTVLQKQESPKESLYGCLGKMTRTQMMKGLRDEKDRF